MNFCNNITVPKFGRVCRNCCTKFNPKESYTLSAGEYSERILESGFCPKCGVFVVALKKRDFNGHWTYEIAKRKKAIRLFNEYQSDIIGNLQKNIKFGNRSNMGFRYGINTQVYDRKNKTTKIKQYAVDFNGVKELIKTKDG